MQNQFSLFIIAKTLLKSAIKTGDLNQRLRRPEAAGKSLSEELLLSKILINNMPAIKPPICAA
jgi:hypothetical protein